MSTRLVMAIAVSAATFFGPMTIHPAGFLAPAPWLGFGIALAVLLSQPPMDLRESTSRGSRDRGSALAILIAMLGAQAAAAAEFASTRHLGGVSVAFLAGAVVAGLGLALRLTAIHTLGRFFTSTVRVTADQTIVQAGPYRWIRHPSYSGALLTALGVTLAFESRIGFTLVLLLCVPAYLYRISVEERALLAELGPSYANYKARTGALVPGLR